MTAANDTGSKPPAYLATVYLVVGTALLVAGAWVGLTGGSPVVATILVLIGAGWLAGWVRWRRRPSGGER